MSEGETVTLKRSVINDFLSAITHARVEGTEEDWADAWRKERALYAALKEADRG